jgi:hypothetical protein
MAMLTEIQRPSQFRVLMRVPRLRHQLPSSQPVEQIKHPPAEDDPPVLEFEVTEVTQQVAEDIATVQGRRWLRPGLLAQVLVVLLAIALALLSRRGSTSPQDEPPTPQLEIPTVTLPAASGAPPAPVAHSEPSAPAIAGGSPSEVTSAPEWALPARPTSSTDPLTAIERLPPVSLEISNTATDASAASAAALPTAVPGTPGVARLEKRIETSKPDAHYDSSQPGLY